MKDAVRQRALELGFDDCRFTTAQPPASGAHLQDWLANRRHGTMAYLERNAAKRTNPQLVLPGAKSVISLAASYAEPRSGLRVGSSGTQATEPRFTKEASRMAHHGLVARYARFTDYHDVLGERLQTLAAFVDQLGGGGTRSLWYVDTGPVLERDLAQRAGTGFIGKHTNVVSRKLGNWIFLAEILTTLELQPDEPEKNRCGSCTRCMTACPTRAIIAPFQLDARLCISYLTIELKGPIPVALRPAIGHRIFGCDDCLAVCPWNRFAREGQLMKPHAKPHLATPDLLELLTLDEAGFRRRFAGTPMLRAKRRGMVRNACVALGNVADAGALPCLQRITGESDELLAEHAQWALERIRSRGASKPECR